jgi:hypothetical protein
VYSAVDNPNIVKPELPREIFKPFAGYTTATISSHIMEAHLNYLSTFNTWKNNFSSASIKPVYEDS